MEYHIDKIGELCLMGENIEIPSKREAFIKKAIDELARCLNRMERLYNKIELENKEHALMNRREKEIAHAEKCINSLLPLMTIMNLQMN